MMHGSLCLKNGILYVGRHELTAHVRPYDLDGAPLGAGFSFGGRSAAGEACARRAAIAGLDVDADHVVWVADAASASVRCFNLFGLEVAGFAGRREPKDDALGALREPADLALEERTDDGPLCWVASGGRRRHALQVFDASGACLESLRPEGDPEGRFRGVSAVAVHGRDACVCERSAGRVQIFRNRAFHFSFRIPVNGDAHFEPVAAIPLSDGRIVVAQGGPRSAILLVDGAGRLVRVLADTGASAGSVSELGDLAVEESPFDRSTRIAAIDCDAERVQVFTLEGRCYGSFESLPGAAP